MNRRRDSQASDDKEEHDVETSSESLDYGEADDISSESGSARLESREKRRQRQELLGLKVRERTKLPNKGLVSDEYSREEFKKERFHFISLDAYSRHKIMVNNYLRFYGGSMNDFKRDSSTDKTDFDVLRENHRFLWEDGDEANTWEKRVAKKYYDKLFKEYCIADLSLYKKNKIALRWRIEKEVIKGKGQFICGEKHCEEADLLRSWEVNFGYLEGGEKKNALVKLRLCSDCSYKLNYHHQRKELTKPSKKRKAEQTTDEERNKRTRTEEADEQQNNDDNKQQDKRQTTTSKDDVWTKERVVEVEKSKEEEFDEYFEDMFL